jgi:hypothetical protein
MLVANFKSNNGQPGADFVELHAQRIEQAISCAGEALLRQYRHVSQVRVLLKKYGF